MNSIDILLIEDDRATCNEFEACINNTTELHLIGTVDGSSEALRIVKQFEPHVVILDLELNEGDGSEFLEGVHNLSLSHFPYIIVNTKNIYEATLKYFRENGAAYIFNKNTRNYEPAQVIRFIMRMKKYLYKTTETVQSKQLSTQPTKQFSEDDVIEELNQIGITSKLLGQDYLLRAVCILRDRNKGFINMKEDVYEPIAKRYGVSIDSVHRNILTAIEIAWSNGNKEHIQYYYGHLTNALKDKPTCKEFCLALAERFK